MVIALAEKLKPETSKRTIAHTLIDMPEFIVFCPNCKTLETLSFTNGQLMKTRKFTQNGDGIYHACGSKKPCHLYRGY